jgi:hypothetical protein
MKNYLLFLDLSTWCFLGLGDQYSSATPHLSVGEIDRFSHNCLDRESSDRSSPERTHCLRSHHGRNCPMDKLEKYRGKRSKIDPIPPVSDRSLKQN